MNPVYSPGSSGVPYANAKGIGYPAGFPMGYAAAAPAYSPNMYPGANPTFQTGYTPGTPYKVSCSPTSGAVPPYSSSPQPLPDCRVPRAKCLPPAEPIRTARYVLHTAAVCSTPPRHPPHHGGAAQWHASDGVPCTHPSSQRQRGHHGHGGWDHYGHVSRYPADCSLPNSRCPTPSHCAHLPGPRNTHLQLCAPSVV
ncbi:myelin-associated neurite-outgrowth inhibitor, partial [Daubentonia madagascariensis]